MGLALEYAQRHRTSILYVCVYDLGGDGGGGEGVGLRHLSQQFTSSLLPFVLPLKFWENAFQAYGAQPHPHTHTHIDILCSVAAGGSHQNRAGIIEFHCK